MHKPISFKDVSLYFCNNICFERFSTQIYPGNRIALIGRNGSGKSSLLNILRKRLIPSSGQVTIPDGISIAYVEQTIDHFNNLSGGERLNKRLSQALALCPDVLLLDEPTNHLDQDNRKSLMSTLKRYEGTLVVVTHDTALIRHCIDILWHIDNNKVHEFVGSYDDYMREIRQKRESVEKKISLLKNEKKQMHNALMKEQKRAAKSKRKGQKSIRQKKWPTVVSKSKALNAQETSGKKKLALNKKKERITGELSDLNLPEIILPTFSLTAQSVSSKDLLSIHYADIGYSVDQIIIKNLSLSLQRTERIAICGKNASGKSTLLKALLMKKEIVRTGDWHLPSIKNVGYLDQHYSTLHPQLSVIEHIKNERPDWNEMEIRRHLSSFLFRKNEEVAQISSHLSGGEKARLCLSLIAAKTPELLILDEVTNNLDLETKEHVVQVLIKYPGAMIVVSHDEDFIKAINIDHTYVIVDRKLTHSC